MAAQYTHSFQEALQQAQAEAIRREHQELQPEHLVYALLSSDSGEENNVVKNVLELVGADPAQITQKLDKALSKLPRVSGGSGQIYASSQFNRLIVLAEDEAKKLRDEYVSGEHCLLALLS